MFTNPIENYLRDANDISKICFITLSGNKFRISFPALVVDSCTEAMQGADILIGNDVTSSLLGFNIPLEGDATLSFWKDGDKESKSREIITVKFNEVFGDRMLGLDLTSNPETMEVEKMASKEDGSKQHLIELGKDQCERMIVDNDSSSRKDTNNSNDLGAISNSRGDSALLNQRVLEDFSVIDTSRCNPTPETMKLLFEFNALKKKLDELVIPTKTIFEVKEKGKGSNKYRRLKEQETRMFAEFEEKRDKLERRLAVIQQRLALKKKKYKKANQRKIRNKRSKELDLKLRTIPRYPIKDNIIENSKLVEKSSEGFYGLDFSSGKDKPFEIEENPLEMILKDSEIVSVIADHSAEASKKFFGCKNKKDLVKNYVVNQLKSMIKGKLMQNEECISTIRSTMDML